MLSLSALGRTSVCAALFASACVATIGDAPADREPSPEAPAPPYEPGEERLLRLTVGQYRNAIRDIVGPEVVVPSALEPDSDVQGLLQVGAGLSSISARGVEQYETAAYAIAEQALGDPAVRDRLVPCEPAAVVDSTCARSFVTAFGLRAYRRPLETVEADALVAIADAAASTLGSFDRGLEFAMAAMLQSPNFLFRAELGVPDPDATAWRRLEAYELATRLAFFFWNTVPDPALLDAAATGALDTDAGLEAEVARLLEDDRARDGVRAFFEDMLRLRALGSIDKDPMKFVHMSAELAPSAREETLLGLEQMVFELDGDYRDALTTRTTFLDRRLAAIYEVPAPSRDGFGTATLPEDGLRLGLLGQVSFLAPNAHAVNTSPTLRGKYVREVLLCGAIPPPPAMASTGIADPSDEASTVRDRVAQHLTEPSCRACHQLMDPIGLAFENFDAIGAFREYERYFDPEGNLLYEAPVDASGDFEGVYYENASELAALLRDHPDVPRCLVRTLYRYATGRVEEPRETEALHELRDAFEAEGYRVRALMRDLALHRSFRLSVAPAGLEVP